MRISRGASHGDFKRRLATRFLLPLAMVVMAQLTFSSTAQGQPVPRSDDKPIVLAHDRHEIDFEDEDFGEVASICCSACFIIIPFLFFLSSLLIGLLVYRKAKRRGDPDAALWGLLGVLLNIFGLFIYLSARGGGR